MANIERHPGTPIGLGFIAGGGMLGLTAELDEVVQDAAVLLAEAYGMPVVIRFNSDRHSGGAWLKTDEPDGVWLNAEVGICASLVTQERNERILRRFPEWAKDGWTTREPGIYIYAHVGDRVGERTHLEVKSIDAALAYVQEHADLSRLTTDRGPNQSH